MPFLVFNNYLKHPEPYKHFTSILPSEDHAPFQVKTILPLKSHIGKRQLSFSCAPITLNSNTLEGQKQYLELYFATAVLKKYLNLKKFKVL